MFYVILRKFTNCNKLISVRAKLIDYALEHDLDHEAFKILEDMKEVLNRMQEILKNYRL